MLRFARTCALLVFCGFPTVAQGLAELHLADDTLLSAASPAVTPARVPVLFVHGHSFDPTDIDNVTDDPGNPNYKRNFWDALNDLPSFKLALDHNSGLAIEPYFIRFEDQARSITEDARNIEDAIDRIVQRHNPDYDLNAIIAPPPVQVVIIAYSKGTISARLYLKSLISQVQDLAPAPGETTPLALKAPRPNYRPVSEFIAISPPNHGMALATSRSTTKLSVQQLHDGAKAASLFGTGCGESYNEPRATGFISTLNGHPTTDTQSAVSDIFPTEAPGARRDGEAPHRGVLYVALYAANNADSVGGDTPSGDCLGRVVARNLAADGSGPIAVNLTINNIPGTFPFTVHANTVHFGDVICKTLLTAVHHRSPGNEACTTVTVNVAGNNVDVPVVRLPASAAAMLALDISGSMGVPACPGCTASRLDVLKDSVELFARLWLMMGRSDDRLGVTYFSSAVSHFPPTGELLPALTPANVTALIADMRAKVPGGLTAMGGGLQRSVEALNTLAPAQTGPRHVILFTDGMQNVNPMVHQLSAEPPQHDIRDEPGRPASGVTPTNLRLDMLPGVTVDTIGIGTGQAFLDLLADIAGQSGGITSSGAGGIALSTINAEDLRQFFIEALINTLRGFSPQLVAYRRGTLGAAAATETFQVNKSARKLLFKVSWPQTQKVDVRVFRENSEVTSAARSVAGGYYRILAFDLPATGATGALAGQWTVRIAGPKDTRYEAAAIVDEPELRYGVQVPRVRVDAPLNITLNLSAGNRVIDGAVSVSATIERPRVAVGNLLAGRRQSDPQTPEREPGMTPGERRLASIFENPRLWKKLAARSETVRLQGDGKGAFRAVLRNVTIPGLYRVTVNIKGTDSRIGSFERTETAMALVRFGTADPSASDLTVQGKDKAVELTLRPRDRRQNLLGPGLAGEIKLAVEGRVQSIPEDLGDGRYRFTVPPTEDANPPLTLTVSGRPLYKGTLRELRTRKPPPVSR